MPDATKRARGEEVRLSADHFERILEIASDAVVCVDESQKIIFFNRGAEETFGYEAGEVLGRPLEILIPEDARKAHPGHIRNFDAGPVVARRMGERGKISGRRKGGEIFPAEASISKLDVAGRKVFTAVLRDRSEQRAADAEIAALLESEREARSDAEAATLARDEALRIISHDLGNSLSAVTVNAQVLLRMIPEGDEGDDVRARVENIRELAKQMQRLRDDLHDVTRIESGRLFIEVDHHDPGALVQETLDHLLPLASEKAIRLTGEAAAGLPPVAVDRQRLLQVMSNLIGNAIKFCPRGAAVSLRADASPEGVRFGVMDEGPGIPAADLPHIFDRFWQAKHAQRAGAGLGLAIARGIVEAHGGRMWVESVEGAGSTFYFSLPSKPVSGA